MKVISFLWQLPQHILAGILYFLYRRKIVRTTEFSIRKVFWIRSIKWGISLGDYIFVDSAASYSLTVKHENGHCLQSQYLGPLYLIIVGIPSITMNILSGILYRLGKPKMALNYYKRWPESWADKLGGVER